MSVSLFLVPAASHTALVRGRRPVDSGTLVVVGRPHRLAFVLHRDVLAALGCRDDVLAANKVHGEERTLLLIRAWLAAHRCGTVVVAHADMVKSPAWFGPLMDAVHAAGARFALVCDDTGGEDVANWVESVGGRVGDTTDLAAFLAEHTPRGATPTDGPDAPAEDTFPALLPQAAFYAFRARCRDLLDPADFAAVDSVYRDTFATFSIEEDTSAGQVAARLTEAISACTAPGQVVPLVRGAQAALFTRGLLLSVDVGPAQDAVRDRIHRVITDSEIRALRAYREPWVGVATVVRSMDLEYLNMKNMRLRNVDEEGRYTSKGLKREAPESARVLFRAQRHLRLLEGAGPDDRFLPQGPRQVVNAVRCTKADLNLPGLARSARSNEKDWKDKMRIRVRTLTLHP